MADEWREDIRRKIENGEYNCEKELTLSVIGGKWKVTLLYHLGNEGPLRYSEILRLFPKITHKVLTQQLRELEEDGVVKRKVFPEVPPRVEYSLTEWGQGLLPILQLMYDWGKAQMRKFRRAAVGRGD